MTTDDRPALSQALLVLSETFNEPVSETRAEAYFVALSDLPIEAVVLATRTALRACRFFPKPIELRELALGSREDRADLAWGDVIQAVKRVGSWRHPLFDDPAVLPAIEAVWGSWVSLCETLPNDGPELVGWIKQFKRAYQSVDARAEHETAVKQLPADLQKALSGMASMKVMK